MTGYVPCCRHMEDGVLELLHLVTTLSSALHEDCFLVAQRSDHLQWWPRYEQLLDGSSP